nr:MAG TPA: hypothetical protein [Bacteriophage sp.]
MDMTVLNTKTCTIHIWLTIMEYLTQIRQNQL